MRLMSSACWEGIFTTIRNLFHTFMFYILKSTYLYHSRGYFFLNNYFFGIIGSFRSLRYLVRLRGMDIVSGLLNFCKYSSSLATQALFTGMWYLMAINLRWTSWHGSRAWFRRDQVSCYTHISLPFPVARAMYLPAPRASCAVVLPTGASCTPP